jgi:hypothetical protein
MADIAAVFHWPPREMQPMSVEELAGWWHRARARAEPGDQDG